MSGYYPDGLTQASFDRYWQYLDDPEPEEPPQDEWIECSECENSDYTLGVDCPKCAGTGMVKSC